MHLMGVGGYVELVVYRVPIAVYVTVCRQLHAVVRIAVCGDHCSPISDTTIMASAGAQCNHVNHVSTQLPYAMTVAAVSCITYVIAGILQNAVICLVIGIALQIGVLLAIKAITKDHTDRVKTTN